MKFLKRILIKIAIFIINRYVVVPDHGFTASGSMVDKQSLFLQNAAKLIIYAHTLPGVKLTGGELLRTPEQQALYVAQGKSKTSNSKHLKKLAIDLHLFVDGVYRTDNKSYKELAEYWRSLNPNNEAGYYWGWDGNHFEMK